MNLTTYSPILVLIFVWILLWILMDIHFQTLTRGQKWLVPLLILFLALFNHILRNQIGAAAYVKGILFTMHLPFFLIFLYISKCSAIKMLFMILSALIFTAPTVIVSGLIRRFFPDISWVMLLANVSTYVLTLLLAQFVFRKGFNYLLKYGDNRHFLLFSLVPLLYYIYVFATQNVDFSSFSSFSGYVVRYLPTLEVFAFYFLLLNNYKDLSERKDLETAQVALIQELDSMAEQIVLLNTTQKQTAVYRHDMRHHLNVIDGFLSADSPQQAAEYIKKVQADVEAITPRRFCGNELLNLLCSSFSDKAERLGICLKIDARLSGAVSISDTEFCSLISNSLENALYAVSRLEASQRQVELSCKSKQDRLLLEIRNPYAGEIYMQDGLPVSGRKGHGYGCRSIRTITERYQGMCNFEAENGVFTLRIVLPMHSPVN